jgi:serine/threonine-protein kinase
MTDLQDQLRNTLGGSYTIDRELGGGGMSRVFVAEERALGRQVVVKVLAPDLASGLSLDRFKREIALAAQLQHPHIVPLLAAGDVGGLPYFTMPLVEGETLRTRISRAGELPIAAAVRLLRDIASAIAYAHRKGVVHRDIKPENILLTDDHAVVTDFGVAKALVDATEGGASQGRMTAVGVAVGTPAYMAPEQAAGDPSTDHRADIYAFGVVAYELLTGSPPFEGRTLQALMAAHAATSPAPLTTRRATVPASLEMLVMRCLAKRPADRPQRAEDIVRELDVVTTPMAVERDARAPGRRRVPTLWVLLVAAICVVSTGGYMVWRRNAVPTVRPSIAVWPVDNEGGEGDAHFADGLTVELISALGKVDAIDVRGGPTSVFDLKRKGLNAASIGTALHVVYVLEGTMRRDGDRKRITMTLVRASDNHNVWTNSYQAGTNDVLAVQEQIAQAVVRALSVRLAAAVGPLVRHGTADPVAYDFFTEGRSARLRYGIDGLRKAIGLFGQAIARDSNYADAWAWLGSTHTLLTAFAGEPASVQLPIARADVDKALKLDSNLADAHWMRGEIISIQDHDFATAIGEHRRALQLDPKNSRARFFLGMLTPQVGGSAQEALSLLSEALEMDPQASEAMMALATVYSSMMPLGSSVHIDSVARLDSAIRYLRNAVAIRPEFIFAREQLGLTYLVAGVRDSAIAELERSARAGASNDSAQLAFGYAMTRNQPKARTILSRLLASDRMRYIAPTDIALIYVGLQDKDKAFEWLEKAYYAHDPILATTAAIWWAPVHSDPRYLDLMRRIMTKPK